MSETELKLELPNTYNIESLVSGLKCIKKRHFEDNWLYDRNNELINHASALRVRVTEQRTILTFKGPSTFTENGIKTRPEFEVDVSDSKILTQILESLHYSCIFRYQKYRTSYQFDSETLLEIDETPIGCFLEIEGPKPNIERVCDHLKLGNLETITESYPKLYLRRRGPGDPKDMLFLQKDDAPDSTQ